MKSSEGRIVSKRLKYLKIQSKKVKYTYNKKIIFTKLMRYVEKNLPLLLFLNKNNRINMGKRNSNLFKALKFYLFYVLVVLITTPLVVYLISFFVEKYFFERNVSSIVR